jgi:hypothetical protein
MDILYPISKIFDIKGLIWSFDIEVIGPATYVCGEDAAQRLGTYSVRRGLMRSDYPWQPVLDGCRIMMPGIANKFCIKIANFTGALQGRRLRMISEDSADC